MAFSIVKEPWVWVGIALGWALLARRYAALMPRAASQIAPVDEALVPLAIRGKVARARARLEALGFAPLGWTQCWSGERSVANPFTFLLRHPDIEIIAGLTAVAAGAPAPPLIIRLETPLDDGWTLETWDGWTARDPRSWQASRRESWALTIEGLYRDHLRFLAGDARPDRPGAASLHEQAERQASTARLAWQQFLESHWFGRDEAGGRSLNTAWLILNVPRFLWSDLVFETLILLRGRRWTGPNDVTGSSVLARMKSHWLAFGLVAAVLAAVLTPPLGKSKKTRPGRDVRPAALDPAGPGASLPGPSSGAEPPENERPPLPILAQAVERPDGPELRLQAGGGEVTVRLHCARPVGIDTLTWGEGDLVPPANRASGQAFVRAVADWLGLPRPASSGGARLAKVSLSYVVLSRNQRGRTFKLTIQSAGRSAEFKLDVEAHGRGQLREKSAHYRRDLLGVLALALQGEQPRRTRADPLIEADEPLFAPLRAPTGEQKLAHLVALPGGLLGAATRADRTSELLWWADPERPPKRVGAVKGAVRGLVASPSGRHCAVVSSMRTGEGWSPTDPETIAVLTLAAGSQRELVTGPVRLLPPVWSPSGDQLAVPEDRGEHVIGTDVYDIESGRLLAGTAPGLPAWPVAWPPTGLLLQGRFSPEHPRGAYYRWNIGQGQPQPVPRSAIAAESRDGRFRVAAHRHSLEVTGPGGRRILVFQTWEDQRIPEFLGYVPQGHWFPGDRMLFPLDDPMVLNLATGKLQYLFGEELVQFLAVSSDGQRAVASDEEGRLLWAPRRQVFSGSQSGSGSP